MFLRSAHGRQRLLLEPTETDHADALHIVASMLSNEGAGGQQLQLWTRSGPTVSQKCMKVNRTRKEFQIVLRALCAFKNSVEKVGMYFSRRGNSKDAVMKISNTCQVSHVLTDGRTVDKSREVTATCHRNAACFFITVYTAGVQKDDA